MIILLIIAVLAISGGVLFFFNQNTHTEPPTDSDYDINSLKHAITTTIASSDTNRPERFIQLEMMLIGKRTVGSKNTVLNLCTNKRL